jgi:DNA-binding GntR family transcriptional regulator
MAHARSKRFTVPESPFAAQKKMKLPSLADQVYEHLRTDIIRGTLSPGQKLVELEIATQMGTSQGPVREALQRLEHDGLVERWARSATFVTAISTDEVYELFYVRSVIEGFAIGRTAHHITPAQCEELQGLVQRMESAGREADILTLSEYDMEFHRLICEWSGSASLLRGWLSLSNQIQRFVVHSHPRYYPDLIEVGTRHQPIVDGLRAHDTKKASQTLQDHIMLIWTQFNPQAAREQPDRILPGT